MRLDVKMEKPGGSSLSAGEGCRSIFCGICQVIWSECLRTGGHGRQTHGRKPVFVWLSQNGASSKRVFIGNLHLFTKYAGFSLKKIAGVPLREITGRGTPVKDGEPGLHQRN